MKIRPLHDRIVVDRLDEEDTSKGGIVIPSTAKEKPSRGKVVAVGTGKQLDNGQLRSLEVKVGDQVLFGKYAGTEVKVGDNEYVVMREDDIMGLIEE
ncbi:co-chaperone GroES [Coxiella endosymbiont of Amblyomma nuttalli]|uniref:co-chaperone GroES n=1 Tax=Coxiella endosymbiont of Amblyomma nuttalli TaxID=2749996 RepID=UPI001BAAEFB9|nr:co-chaperone GroES [Coxiella endosymbiont of Amblyomma nuttalli]QTS83727.1 10 kDa chaperonin [Coxiella endosymbiont of Amblyomma nuttalli]